MTRAEQLAVLLMTVEAREQRRVRWNRRTWPGRDAWRPPPSPRRAERLRHRLVLYVVSFAARGVTPESFGLGASLLCIGGVVLSGWLVYDDALNRTGRRALETWVARPANHVQTCFGPRPLELVSLRTFNNEVLAAHGYVGRCTVAGSDLGRTLGLHADWWRPARRRRWDGAWSVGLRGWGVHSPKDQSRFVRSTGRPLLYLQGVSAYGVRAGFAKPRESFDTEPRGQWVKNANGKSVPYAGRFVDVVPASHGLGGVDSADLDDHLMAWGLPPVGAPFAVVPDADGAEVATRTVAAVHTLALVLDDEADRWGGLDLRWLYSPGSVAQQLLVRMGVAPPLQKFDLSDEEYACWTAGLHGGWVEAILCGVSFPAVDVDVRSAYPAVAVLLDWWRYLSARDLRLQDVTADFRAFLGSPDLAIQLRDKATWRRWGLTRVVLRLYGEPVPVELPRPGRGSRLYVRRACAERYDCAWPDAVLARLLSGRAVEVLEAVQLVPVGRQDGLFSVEIPGALLDPRADPAVMLVLRRRKAQRDGDRRLAAAIRVIVNSLVYGNAARFDPTPDGVERPGPFCFPPLASSVAAGCRLLLALFEHELELCGSGALYRDTDGAMFPADFGGGHGEA